MAIRIVGVVVARDEERHLGPCLDSLAWTDSQLVLLDARTADRSGAVATERGAAVVVQEFRNFATQRNAALDLIRSRDLGDWVIFLDADERASPELAREIRNAVASEAADPPVGYWIPRRNFIWGGWIRNGGWSPDHQLRLLRVDYSRYDEDRVVHELVNLRGQSGRLGEAMIHYNYDSFGQFLRKQWQYSRLDAQRLKREGIRPRPWTFVLQPLREFRRRYIELGGYRDGWRGLALAALLGYYTESTYIELMKDRRKST